MEHFTCLLVCQIQNAVVGNLIDSLSEMEKNKHKKLKAFLTDERQVNVTQHEVMLLFNCAQKDDLSVERPFPDAELKLLL